jgi:hypothetical protein
MGLFLVQWPCWPRNAHRRGYSSRIIAERTATAHVALDIQTGGGEVLAQIPHPPTVLMATESWPPNVEIARRNLQHVGARVVEVDDHADLPFPAEHFDLVVSRHPTVTLWDEIARVMPGTVGARPPAVPARYSGHHQPQQTSLGDGRVGGRRRRIDVGCPFLDSAPRRRATRSSTTALTAA